MASEMVLANVLNESTGLESIISTQWCYSSEIRVGYLQSLFRIGLLLFPDNWHMVRIVSHAAFLAIIAGSYLFFAYSTGMSKGAFWIAGALMLPVSGAYMYIITYGGSYLTHMISIILTVGFVVKMIRTDKKWVKVMCSFLLFGVAFVGGLNGVRLLMNCYAPLVLACGIIFCTYIFSKDAKQLMQQSKSCLLGLSIATIVATTGAILGYVVNSKILSTICTYATYSDKTMLGRINIHDFFSRVIDFIELFGWQAGSYTSTPLLVSFRGIASFIGLLMGMAVFFSAIRLLFRWKRLIFVHKLVLALFWSMFLFSGLLFSSTLMFGYTPYYETYWVPIIPMAYAVVHIEGITEEFDFVWLKRLMAIGFATCLAVCAIATTQDFKKREPYFSNKDIVQVSDWLVTNGYYQGYATFWNSNVITEHSNGKIEMWTVDSLDSLSVTSWLQKKSHKEEMPHGKLFIIMPASQTVWYEEPGGGNLIYQSDSFRIIGFENATELQTAMGMR